MTSIKHMLTSLLASNTLFRSRLALLASRSTLTLIPAPLTSGSGGPYHRICMPVRKYLTPLHSSELSRASRQSKGHTIYDPTKSSTAKKASGTWNISYGDGSSASGNVYTDTVTVADVVIEGQAIELAEKLSSRKRKLM